MGIGIKIPNELYIKQKEVQTTTTQKKRLNDDSKLFDSDYINALVDHVNSLESFIRTNCFNDGNWIIDPSAEPYNSGLPFTGQFLLWLSHDYDILIHSRIDNPNMINKQVQLHLDMEAYIKGTGCNDGLALSMIQRIVRAIQFTQGEQAAWKKFEELKTFINSIDMNTVTWVCGDWYNRMRLITPESTAKFGKRYWDAYVDMTGLYLDQFYAPENKTLLVQTIKKWNDAIADALVTENAFENIGYAQCLTVYSISLFERAVSVIWYSDDIPGYEKIEILARLIGEHAAANYVANAGMKEDNLQIQERRRGLEVIPQVEEWMVSLFIAELCKPNNSVNMDIVIANIKKGQAFDRFKTTVINSISAIESIITLVGDNFLPFYNNIIALQDDEITAALAKSLAKCSMINLANELMLTVQDPALKTTYELSDINISYILTKVVNKDVLSNIDIAHNIKNGVATIFVDNIDGTTEEMQTEIVNYFSVTQLVVKSPIVVRVDNDTAFITVR